MGGSSKSSTETYRKRDPEPSELTSLRNSLYQMISPIASGNMSEDWKNSLFGSTYLNSMNNINQAAGNRNQMSDALTNMTTSGELPQSVTDNLNAAINSELRKNTGSLLNDMASRGVINSSVTNRGLGTLSNNAADAYAKNYLNAYNTVSSNLNSGIQTLLGVPDAENSAINTAMDPAYNLWKDWDTLYSNRDDYDYVVHEGGGK